MIRRGAKKNARKAKLKPLLLPPRLEETFGVFAAAFQQLSVDIQLSLCSCAAAQESVLLQCATVYHIKSAYAVWKSTGLDNIIFQVLVDA